MTETLDPRQRDMLSAWRAAASTTATGPDFDLTSDRHTARLKERVEAFVDNPTDRTFETLWSSSTFRGAVVGGPAVVRRSWESVEEFAAFIAEIRDADSYDPDWEEQFVTASMVWELYGRLHPERDPIVSGDACQGLRAFGYETIHSFEDGREAMVTFREDYESVVGHATAGTDHEVPLWDEIETFLHLVHVHDDASVLEDLVAGD